MHFSTSPQKNGHLQSAISKVFTRSFHITKDSGPVVEEIHEFTDGDVENVVTIIENSEAYEHHPVFHFIDPTEKELYGSCISTLCQSPPDGHPT